MNRASRVVVVGFLLISLPYGCGSTGPTPAQAQENFAASLEKQADALAQNVEQGNIPSDIDKILRSAIMLVQRSKNTPLLADAELIHKQVEDLEKLLGSKPEKAAVTASIAKLKELIAAYKGKQKT